MNYSLLKSRTFWTIAGMFVIGGVNAILPFLPAGASAFIEGILGVLAIYFHVNPSQTYNLPK